MTDSAVTPIDFSPNAAGALLPEATATKKTDRSSWIRQELKDARFVHAALVMAVMGWAPSLWTYLLPVLVIYGVVKRKELRAYFRDLFGSEVKAATAEPQEIKKLAKLSFFMGKLSRWIAKRIESAPLDAAKFSLALYIVAIASMPWSFLMLYALYSSKQETLSAAHKQFMTISSLVKKFLTPLSNTKKTFFVLVAAALISAALSPVFANSGLFGIFDAVMTIGMLALTTVGFRLVLTHLRQSFSRPFVTLTTKMGAFLGMIAGNRWAHWWFSGSLTTPATTMVHHGTVRSSGFFSSIYGMFFSTNPYGTSQTYISTVGSSIFSRLSTGLGSVAGSLFFDQTIAITYTQSVVGTLGPSAYQLFVFMAIGAMVGYFIDKTIDRVSHDFYNDANIAWENKPESLSHSNKIDKFKSLVRFTNDYRYPVISSLVVTGLLGLATPIGSSVLLLALTESALLAPALLTAKTYRSIKAHYAKKPEAQQQSVTDNTPAATQVDNNILAAIPPLLVFSPDGIAAAAGTTNTNSAIKPEPLAELELANPTPPALS